MKKEVMTTQGKKEITLTQAQIVEFAAQGDKEAKKELLSQSLGLAASNTERLDAIEKYLLQ